MRHLPEIDTFAKGFAQCQTEPLTVSINLASNSKIVNYNPISLDSLLAYAVVDKATRGRGVDSAQGPYWIPLPLKMLWQRADEAPLWSASALYPVGYYVNDILIRAKRNSDGMFLNRVSVTTNIGPWMPRQKKTPIVVCNRLEARCIGNKTMIEHLLKSITHIGKFRLARIRAIEVTSAQYRENNILYANNKLLRDIPEESGVISVDAPPSLVGWTPPYWRSDLFTAGWPTGTPVRQDSESHGSRTLAD